MPILPSGWLARRPDDQFAAAFVANSTSKAGNSCSVFVGGHWSRVPAL
jgi:hypothetical protein